MRNIRGSENRGIILLSGGIDSTVTLYLAKKYGYKLHALIFDYGQRHKKEIVCAKRIAQLNKIKYFLVKINISWTKSSLIQKKMKIPFNRDLAKKEVPSTYVSARNIIFLSYAASLAESVKAKKIFIGAHIQDYSGYPDCRPEFLLAMEKALNLGLKEKRIKIEAPLINKNKKEIIKLGKELSVPFHLTWSCYKGGRFPCRRCDSCRFRINAFRELGLVDPLLKKCRQR
ncbi:MAG: 7-cyano-7-deazaguanine synthase QueC [Candidatus Omnitrophica bacterium 4484_70.1]|nr:MAG: 7-cyano-7-deazaguanine synthase QueC [Candidatus Omnitrophica bacterium 4484_70.1]